MCFDNNEHTAHTKGGEHMKHTYYRTCPMCGSNLDPGEQCDCEQKGSEVNADDGSRKGSAAGL